MTNDEQTTAELGQKFVVCALSFIRHSSLVIRHSCHWFLSLP